MRHIDTADGAQAIATEILSARTRPLALISTLPEGGFAFDPEKVAAELGGDADVVTIVTGSVTCALEGLLPAKAHVFNGTARSYPPDFGADPDWQRSLLRWPGRDEADLVEDALAQVVVRPFDMPVRRTWVSAVVELVSGSEVGNVACLADGQRVMVVADSLPSSVRLADALEVGDTVEGWLTGKDLAPEQAPVDMAAFVPGMVTLARVTKVTDLRASVTLHPLAPEHVLRKRAVLPGVDDGEHGDVKVSDVLHVGQTVRVRAVPDGAGITLTLIGADDEDLPFVAPPPILRGGVPWLREGVHSAAAPAPASPQPTSALPSPAPVPAPATDPPPTPAPDQANAGDLARIREELAGMKDALLRLGHEVRSGTDLETLDQLRDDNSALSVELRRARAALSEQTTLAARLRQEVREARNTRPEPQLSGARTDRSAWPDEEAWLRHEVIGTWAARTLASEKQQYPLVDYVIGPQFLTSVRDLGEGYTEKVFRGIVDVLTGRAAEIPSRQLHRLRQGQGGSDPYVTRTDGAICWRLSLETNTASARRLHYWQLPGGTIELSRVVIHDDVAP